MKNCVEKEVLFDFFNNSLEEYQMQSIRSHVDSCNECKKRLELISMDITLVKGSLNSLNDNTIEIPAFKITEPNFKLKKSSNHIKLISIAASICLLITISALSIIKLIHNQKPVNDYELSVYIPDMNDAWKEQSITVTHYSEDGTPIDHQIIRN